MYMHMPCDQCLVLRPQHSEHISSVVDHDCVAPGCQSCAAVLLQVIAQPGQRPSSCPRWCRSPEYSACKLRGAQGRRCCRRPYIVRYSPTINTVTCTMDISAATSIITMISLPHADAANRGAFAGGALPQASLVPYKGQIASMLHMSQLHRADAEADQPLRKPLLNFLEQSGAEPMYADSVRRKRKTKMNKHKHRKRLKKMRHGSK